MSGPGKWVATLPWRRNFDSRWGRERANGIRTVLSKLTPRESVGRVTWRLFANESTFMKEYGDTPSQSVWNGGL